MEWWGVLRSAMMGTPTPAMDAVPPVSYNLPFSAIWQFLPLPAPLVLLTVSTALQRLLARTVLYIIPYLMVVF
jgi:hypothetical protein